MNTGRNFMKKTVAGTVALSMGGLMLHGPVIAGG